MARWTDTSIESAHPFQDQDELSDLVLVVQGQKLHVHRMYLALCSPVFKCMLYSEFREQWADEIELPGKKCNDIVNFLSQLYPVQSLRKKIYDLSDDELFAVVLLAEEYQVEHIRQKLCNFLEAKINSKAFNYAVSFKTHLFDMCLCDRCHFQRGKEEVKNCLQSYVTPELLTNSQWFVKLDEQLMGDIMASAVRNEERFEKNLEEWEQEKERRRCGAELCVKKKKDKHTCSEWIYSSNSSICYSCDKLLAV